ncbi:hypothetical protein EVAR_53929_1 [Eumeta japonica]|uniref:Uncharacterized protein n=1 Tax=Eumeta variegata TaxID=151549 RepID=A0A4C1YI59_EUMVA|nr:hypothetical protein EVAR_53929_1 [Eumeta japonica]
MKNFASLPQKSAVEGDWDKERLGVEGSCANRTLAGISARWTDNVIEGMMPQESTRTILTTQRMVAIDLYAKSLASTGYRLDQREGCFLWYLLQFQQSQQSLKEIGQMLIKHSHAGPNLAIARNWNGWIGEIPDPQTIRMQSFVPASEGFGRQLPFHQSARPSSTHYPFNPIL